MQYEARLCFDECLPRKWCGRLGELLAQRREPVDCFHLVDQYVAGADDDAVAKWLAEQSPPVIMITGDTGAQSKAGAPRLPLLLPEQGVTGIFLTPRLCQRNGFEKIRMVIVCLPEILAAYRGPAGRRYKLQAIPSSRELYALKDWPFE